MSYDEYCGFYTLVKKQCMRDGVLFFATRTTIYLVRIVSLPVGKNNTILRTMFTFVLNDAENIPLSTNTPSPPPSSIQRYRQLADSDWLLDS